ncbi:DEAD/DEAH box helicase [Dyadobacter arcticus]|uniref:SNF2 family DNA or RNA helicase n=1 Tax=Dyadobacter arcticus TaxID=1078754 RepID=A0ABX0URX7_9BACT|nr:DEAD/DEAH box helicase [Dyadobacter arcticus]NIJ53736.1 SNF2 family DNA or RNA helicase [Dyadobacter arcticus]
MRKNEPAATANPSLHNFTFPDFNISALSTAHILQNSAELPSTDRRGFFDIQPYEIDVNYSAFKIPGSATESFKVVIKQNESDVNLYCSCSTPKRKLCEHQIQVLYNLMKHKDLRAFFDQKLRFEKIRQVAVDYGLENDPDPDHYFKLELVNKELLIKPKLKEMIPVNAAWTTQLADQLVSKPVLQLPGAGNVPENLKTIAVFGLNKYYEHFYIELYEASVTTNGKLKNPLAPSNPLEQVWATEDTTVIKFHTAVSAFQNNFRKRKPETDIAGLKSILKNPLNLEFYYHDNAASENFSAASLIPVRLAHSATDMQLSIDQKDKFYHISGHLILDGIYLDLEKVQLRYDYFVLYQNSLYLIDSEDVLNTIQFFRQHNQKIIIHETKFEDFRQSVLSRIEDKIGIIYSYLKPATEEQKEEQGFNNEVQKIIYLEEFGNYVLITPVIKYGNVEVALFSRKEIYSVDNHGFPFTVERDQDLENRFASTVLRQHPDFENQLGKNFFYLHRAQFLNEDWFPNAFEEWRDQGVAILGFNNLAKNRLNVHKATVSVSVISGINWFNTTANVKFGKQKVTLKHLHKAVKNRNKYVELGDGTLGILPEQWIEKFAKFFEVGEIVEETIRTPKISFASVSELYEEELLAADVREQIEFYKSRFESFDTIPSIAEPPALNATLRDYQKQGLNWLNFLDEFEFGGCLADDMGLGKTIQVIAFLLTQREKPVRNTNLIIVPTSLIFNWQAEVEKFAPDMKILTIYGSDRIKETVSFDQYEIILTSYGTLLLDVQFLKKYNFNYIILDESQAIKNPESQRYKAAKLLQSRNKLVLTGTPVENNTFDLYGQLSFACPGLLGSKFQFKHHFSTPIDRFKENDKARELQKRINPFILRRTKKQVATELPDKTEMVIYCEMGDEQRKVYNAYELEFYTFLNTKNEVDIQRQTLHVLQGLTKLRQICNSPALLNDDAYYGNASSKIDTLMEQIETKSPQHKILVFSQFVTMLDLIRPELEKRGIGFEYLTGQTKDRASKVENFQTNPDVRVFLISLKAGGTGLNLTEADYVYLIDPWWNPAVENQAIDRSYRIGQKKNVIAVRLICPGTIEEKIMELQESKKDLANDLVKTDTSVLKSLTKKDLLALVFNPNSY